MKYLIADPKIQFGAVTIKGTRIFPETIYGMFKGGDPKKFLCHLYGLSMPQVESAIRYCKKQEIENM